MCSSPNIAPPPEPPPLPPPPPPPPTRVDPAVKASRNNARKKFSAGAGRSGTVLTQPKGLLTQSANTQTKTLLGR